MDLTLRDKGSLVEGLWHSVDDAAGNLKNVPGLVRRVIETEAWREREHRGRVFKHATFLDFITTKPLAGCGWPPEKVEALLKDEPEVLALWREVTTGKPGRPSKQQEETSSNRTIKPIRGTTLSYTLDRLKRDRPDLFERVCDGELTANAAAIEAGFRKLRTALETILKLLPKLTPTERRQLQARLDEMRKRAA